MMDTEIDRELLEKIADLLGKPVGAFNIRKDCGCDGRESQSISRLTIVPMGKAALTSEFWMALWARPATSP